MWGEKQNRAISFNTTPAAALHSTRQVTTQDTLHTTYWLYNIKIKI